MIQILTASRYLLSQRNYLMLFPLVTVVLFFLFILIPSKTIPGNTLAFQLSIFTTRDYLLLFLLSAFTSLLIVMNVYIFGQRKTAGEVGKSGMGSLSSAIGAVFGTATCASCIAALFGFLGLPVLLFLIKLRWFITGTAIVLIVFSVYFASRKVLKVCAECEALVIKNDAK